MKTINKKAIFHNHEEIQPEAWEMQGVSVKHDSTSAIGKFGTGLCYAIAVLLRTGHKVTIKSGSELYEFGLVDMQFRGKDFQRITCNGKPLSFTTHYGHTWEVWGAYRELASNCMDEGGIQFVGEAMEEGTSIVIEGDEIIKCMDNHNEYFLGDREPLATSSIIDVYEGNGNIYYKGVKIGEMENAMYSYEIKSTIKLTEDRTFANQYEISTVISRGLVNGITDDVVIKKLISEVKSWETSCIDYDWTWGEHFKSVVSKLWHENPTALNSKVQKLVPAKIKDATFKIFEFSKIELDMIEKSKSFLAKAGYPILSEIKMVSSADDSLCGFAYKGKIHLTQKAFDEGVFFLTVVLFEENAHINGHEDYSRSFQTYLVKEIIKQSKINLNESL